jgi:hypothetical protein
MRCQVTDEEQVEQVRSWFASKGFDLRVEERDMRDELRLRSRRKAPSASHSHWVDLVSLRTGEVFMRSYGSGPTPTLAVIATEQRWLVEQEDAGAAAGATYVEKAEERLRRGRAMP